MEFLKNIGKEYIYTGNITQFFDSSHYNKMNWLNETIRVSIVNIDNSGVEFQMESYDNIDNMVTAVIENLSDRLTKDVERLKYKLNKVLNEWNSNPTSFVEVEEKRYSDFNFVYVNYSVLTEEEYKENDWISVHFQKYHSSLHNSFKANIYPKYVGYCSKEKIEAILEELDTWYNKEIKNLNTNKLKTRFKNYINDITIKLPFKEVIKNITIPKVSFIIKEKEKPTFPFNIDGRLLNKLLGFFDGYINDKNISEFKEQYDLDVSFLEGCELENETKGSHVNDVDYCDYTVTLTLPDGTQYYAYDSHCLVTGFMFDGEVIFS